MDCCFVPRIKDFTQGQGEYPHYYCMSCKGHLYKGKLYTKKQWEEWINEEPEQKAEENN